MVYLQHGGSQLQAHKDRPVHQLCDLWVDHLQGVLDEVCDVHLPVWSQHGDDLIRALRGSGVELGQDFDHGPLVLESAAAIHSPVVIVVVCIAIPGAP